MPVGVVAGDPPAEPDDVRGAQVVGEDPLEPGLGRAGVAGLDVAEQAFLGRQERPPAVDVDRAAFQDDAGRPVAVDRVDLGLPAVAGRGPWRSPGATRRSRRWLSYLAQPLNSPVDQARRPSRVAVGVDDERRPRVAGPDPVGRDPVEADPVEVDPRPVEPVGRLGARPCRRRPGSRPARPGSGGGRSRRRPRGSARTCRASRRGCGARRSRSPSCGSHSAGIR